MEGCSSEKTFTKRVFSFTSDDRASLDNVSVGSLANVDAKNEEDEIVSISFKVTRDAYLGKGARWIYGEVLDSPAVGYHQIEIKLHKDNPNADTIEIFPQAPPINKLR